MENSRSQPAELYLNTYNIEKAVTNVCSYATREELGFDVQDAFDVIMAEVYDMRRTLKPLMNEDNKTRVEQLKSSRR